MVEANSRRLDMPFAVIFIRLMEKSEALRI
jgi:hypothetical protein